MSEREIKPGERVAAIATSAPGKVYIYGFGVYQGDEAPPISDQDSSEPVEKNPKILLDNGETVWGYECWWLREDTFRKDTPADWIELVSIQRDRREYHGLSEDRGN